MNQRRWWVLMRAALEQYDAGGQWCECWPRALCPSRTGCSVSVWRSVWEHIGPDIKNGYVNTLENVSEFGQKPPPLLFWRSHSIASQAQPSLKEEEDIIQRLSL
ncbi:hypothetical protein MHYP_G00167200 [Metynnis hypsauchen]